MADKNNNNPLDELFTDSGNQIDPANIVNILKPMLRINRDTQKVLFTPKGMKLTASNKIILFVLAKKVSFIQGIATNEEVTPKEIKEELGKNIPAGTIDASIKRLSENGPLKGQSGKYFIPDFNFEQVEQIFSKYNE